MGCINEYKLYQFWWVVYYCVTKIRDYLEDLDTVRSEDPVGVWLEFNQGWRLIWAVSEDWVTKMLRHGNFHREHDDYIIYNQYWPVGLIFLRVSSFFASFWMVCSDLRTADMMDTQELPWISFGIYDQLSRSCLVQNRSIRPKFHAESS